MNAEELAQSSIDQVDCNVARMPTQDELIAKRLGEALLVAVEALESIDLSYVDNKKIAREALAKIRGEK